MSKTVEDVVKALKLKAEPVSGALSLRLGTKKSALPFEVRTLTSGEFVFAHIPPSAAIFRITDGGLELVNDVNTATVAVKSFRTRKTRGEKVAPAIELPDNLARALSSIPDGYKLAFSVDGKARLVKTRQRKSKG